MDREKIEKLKEDIDFLEFLNKEFSKTSIHSTVEEIAEFTFGSMKEAAEEYLAQKEESEK